ncbi:TauD/TfdA family dioxygenase [Actinoplanes oblitus]|uniref:TauD/TfdA family dioxygenase n=1 Tax=Actinoplanes oblitus TaxID=3040509 RepID=A0ABY8W9Q8_9ACTN|nr:TauD/TfdA family dioxygenase [Actinoplanes oblitus]WIM94403.1 TauD/TfdA family dioxygenase [Actinoplanes oblitus]
MMTESGGRAAREVGGTRVMARPDAIRQSDHFELRPCTPTIGADISGLDLSVPLAGPALADLKRAFLDWKVLFFRDQALSPQRHVELARHWGNPVVYPLPDKGEFPELVNLNHGPEDPGVENIWHSDVSYDEAPSLGSILRAVRLPDTGGDTLWADMAAAYDGLAPEVKERIAGLRAVHDLLALFGDERTGAREVAGRGMFRGAEHPVVRVHPETGQKVIYVNRMYTTRILDVSERESDELLKLLCDQAHHPEYQVRFRWSEDAVVMWDNRSTQHYAVSDYYPNRRILERVSIAGDRPRSAARSLRSVARRGATPVPS